MTDDEHKALEILAVEKAQQLAAEGKFPMGQPAGMVVIRLLIKGDDPLECHKHAQKIGQSMVDDILEMDSDSHLFLSVDQLNMAMMSQDASQPASIDDIVKQAKGMADVVGQMAGISGESILDDFRKYLEDAAQEYTLDAYLDEMVAELSKPIYPKGRNE